LQEEVVDIETDEDGMIVAAQSDYGPAIQSIQIDEAAIWNVLKNPDVTQNMRSALSRLLQFSWTPRSIGEGELDIEAWRGDFSNMMGMLDHLQTLLLAQRLNDRIGAVIWVEPLGSMVSGLDFAVDSAVETARQLEAAAESEFLSIDLTEADIDEAFEDENGTDEYDDDVEDGEEEDDDEAIDAIEAGPIFGLGYAFVLQRRFVSDVLTAIELLEAAASEARAEDEE
jgi:hypothetical protein